MEPYGVQLKLSPQFVSKIRNKVKIEDVLYEPALYSSI